MRQGDSRRSSAIAQHTIHVFKRKYVTVKTARGTSTCPKGSSLDGRAKEESDAESQSASAGALVLNSNLPALCPFRNNQSDITSPSSPAIKVPTSRPKRRTAAKTKTSETDRVAGMEGILIVMEPLRSVRAAKGSHVAAAILEYAAYAETPSTTKPTPAMRPT